MAETWGGDWPVSGAANAFTDPNGMTWQRSNAQDALLHAHNTVCFRNGICYVGTVYQRPDGSWRWSILISTPLKTCVGTAETPDIARITISNMLRDGKMSGE